MPQTVFAVQEDELLRDVVRPTTGSGDMDSIKDQLKQVFAVTKDTNVPLALKQSIDQTFWCKIC